MICWVTGDVTGIHLKCVLIFILQLMFEFKDKMKVSSFRVNVARIQPLYGNKEFLV